VLFLADRQTQPPAAGAPGSTASLRLKHNLPRKRECRLTMLSARWFILETAAGMNREPRELRESKGWQGYRRHQTIGTRWVSVSRSQSPVPFVYFAYFAVSTAEFRFIHRQF